MYKVLCGEEIKKYTNTFKRMEKLLPKLNEAECIILEENKENIGYISAWKEDKKYKIENIFIRKEDRYKSAGTKLINFFINHSKKNGKREIEYVGGEQTVISFLKKYFIRKEDRYKSAGTKLINFFINHSKKNGKREIEYVGGEQTVISFLKKYRFKEKDGKIVLDIYEDSKRKKDGFAVVISSIFLNIFLATNTFKRREKILPIVTVAECIILDENIETIGYISAWQEDKKYKIDNIFIRKKDGVAVVISSIFLNIFLAVIKIFGGIKGKSNALLADGFNSLSDVASSTAILLGIHFSNMPEDEDHPYGHEKIESIIGIMVGIFVVITGVELGKDAVIKLLNKDYTAIPNFSTIYLAMVSIVVKYGMYFYKMKIGELGKDAVIKLLNKDYTAIPNFSTIYLAMVSIVVKYGMYFYKMKIGKATKNTALIADARDSKSDVLSSSGVVIGILLSIYVSPIFDIIVSIVVAMYLQFLI